MGVGRVFDGTNDWLKSQMGFPPFGGNVTDSFTVAVWLETSDSAGVDRAIFSIDDSSDSKGFGFYWNKDELIVKHYYRTPATPSNPGNFEEFSEAYTSPVGTPFFIAVTAEMDTPGSAAVPTFRFWAGTTPANIVQIGGDHIASGSIKTTTRNVAFGAATTTGSYTPTAGTYYNGIMERLLFAHYEAYSLADLKEFAEFGQPHKYTTFVDFGDVGGQNFEMWDVLPFFDGNDVEKDIGINYFVAEFQGGMVTGDVTTSILPTPSATWNIASDDIGIGHRISCLCRLDNDTILAGVSKSAIFSSPGEIWSSTDEGANWTQIHTFPSSPMVGDPYMLLDLGSGVVLAVSTVLSENPKVWKSTDYGDTWTEKYQVVSGSIARSLIDMGGGVIFLGTGTGGKLYHSTDSGDNWSEKVTISGINTVNSIIDLGGGTILAGGTANNIYRSTDGGSNFSSYATMTGGTNSNVAMTKLVSGRIIASTNLGNVYVSDDSAATWTRTLDSGDWESLYDDQSGTQSAVIGPVNGNYFIRARAHGWLLETADEGDTWARYHYNTQGPTTQEAGIKLNDNAILLSGNYWLCSGSLLIYEFTEAPIPSEVRDVNQRRVWAYTNPCSSCCDAPDPGPGAPPPPPKYIARMVRDLQQVRVSAWIDVAPAVVGAVNITEIKKLLEYKLSPVGGHLPSGTLATCSLRVRIRILRVADLVQVFELEQYKSLTYSKRWTELNEFELRMSADSAQGIRMRELGIVPSNGEYICNVIIDGLSDFAGFIDHVTVNITNRGEHLWTLRGTGCDRILADRLVLPPAGLDSDEYEGPAETIMKSIVDRHLVNPITTGIPGNDDANRAVLQLLIAPNAGLGSTVKFDGRFQKVHEGLLQISKASNDIGFDVSVAGANLLFEVSEGVNRSASVVLAVELDNLGDFSYDKDGTQFASHVIMGGAGEADVRLMQTASTPTSTRVNIARREVFQDSRDLTTAQALIDRGNALLQDKGQVDTFGGQILLGSHPCYRRDYQVGDLITIKSILYGVSQIVRVMEARVTVEGGALEHADLVFGKPSKRFIETLRSLPPVTASSRI